MRKSLLLSLLLVCSTWVYSYAQDRKVTGKVSTAEDGSALPGVSVVVKGSNTGTNTDSDGNYSVTVPSSATLVFSFVGTVTQEIQVGSRSVIDVQLVSDTKNLQEVVVTAQGIVREKRALGYAVATVDKKLIEDRPQADVGRVLQGKVAGVNITQTSGVSGTGTNIIIRGYSSISGSNQPLFVVDGVPFNSNTNSRGGFTGGGQSASSRFLDLDPNNIENISVLKGLAATVTYGDQGRNGVILVTTKNGSNKARKTELSVTQSVFANQAHLPRYQNDYVGGFQQNLGYFFSNWGPTINEAKIYPSQNTNAALNTHPFAFLTTAGGLRAAMAPYVESLGGYELEVFPNNVKDFFRTGLISTTSLNISGGSEKVSYNLSAGFNDEKGYIPGNGLRRLNLGLGMNAQLSKKLSVVTSFNFANTDQYSPPLSGGTGNNALDFPSILANVMYTPRQVDLMGWPSTNPVTGGSVYFRGGNDIPNPRWMLDNYKTTGVVNRLFTATTFNYQISQDFNLIYKVGLDTYTENQRYEFNKGGTQLPNGFMTTVDIQNRIWDNSLILSYTKNVSDKLVLSGRLGGNMRNDLTNFSGVSSNNQLARGLFRHSNFIDNVAFDNEEEQTRMGIFGEVTADYDNYLFLNVAARNDWTSTVEVANRRILYPSVSLSFVPTTAFKGLESNFMNYLKVRAGYGTSAGFPNPYSTRNILGQSARGFLNSSGATIQTQSVDNFLGNPNLRPELQTEVELGVEGKILNNNVNFDVTVFRRDTRDLITRSPLDASTGYTLTTINLGKIRNEGLEISLGGTPVKIGSFAWTVNGVYSRIIPTTLDLGGQLQEVQIGGGFTNLGNFAVVGEPFNVIKGTAYRRNEQGQLLIDAGGFPLTTTAPVILGDPNPAFTASLINGFTWKGFSLDVMLSYRQGGAMYSSTAGALLGRGLTYDTGLEAGYDRAQTYIYPGVKLSDGQPNDVQITASDVGFNTTYFFGDEGRVFDGTTLRLQELSLGYQLPKVLVSKLKLKGASLTLSGNNLWYRAFNFPPGLNFDTDNLGLGVGNNFGFEYLTGPSAKRYGVTLKVTL